MILATHGILANSGVNPLNIGLFAVYNAENNTNDSYGTNNGTAIGGLTYSTGKIGNAFTFNGTNAYVSLPNNSLNFSGDFSINFWMNLQGVSGDSQAPVSNYQKIGSNYFGYDLYIQNGTLYIQLFNGTTTFNNFATNIGSYYNILTMFTVTISGNSVKLYANASLLNTFTKTVTITYHTTQTPSIGVLNSTAGGLQYYMKNNGKIDLLSFHNTRAITSTEVTQLYNSGSGKLLP